MITEAVVLAHMKTLGFPFSNLDFKNSGQQAKAYNVALRKIKGNTLLFKIRNDLYFKDHPK